VRSNTNTHTPSSRTRLYKVCVCSLSILLLCSSGNPLATVLSLPARLQVSSLTPFWARVSSHPRPPHTASVAADMKVSSWRTRTEAHHSSEGCLCPTQRLPLHLFTTRWRVCLGACACSLSFLPPFAAGHPCWLVGGGKVGLPLARPPYAKSLMTQRLRAFLLSVCLTQNTCTRYFAHP